MVQTRRQILGKRFGKLFVEEQIDDYIRPHNGERVARFRCLCDCGQYCIKQGHEIKDGVMCPGCAHKREVASRTRSHITYIDDLCKLHPTIHPLEEYITNDTKIAHFCEICGYGKNTEWRVRPYSLYAGTGCPCCAGKVIGPAPEYKNSIWASTHREYLSQFLTEQQMKEIQIGTKKRITIHCPNCGREKQIIPYNLLEWRGCICNDHVPFPEKFVYCFLKHLNVKFEFQKTFEWSKLSKKSKKMYDFYVPSCDLIIETHGNQHYVGYGSFQSVEKIQNNDAFKKDLALKNGISQYIILDCSHSTIEHIKQSILNSNLCKILNVNVTDIDWQLCGRFALKNFVQDIANYWNSGMTVGEIIKATMFSMGTVRKYLQQASQLGLCKYNKQEGYQRGWEHNSGSNHHATFPVFCKELGFVFYDGFDCIGRELHINRNTISKSCADPTGIKTAGINPVTKEKLHWLYLEEAINKQLVSKALAEQHASLNVYEILKNKYGTIDFEKPKNRPVVQLLKDGTYVNTFCSISEAGRQTGVWSANISKCCQGELSQSGGCKWRYKDEYEKELNNANTIQND